jgi:tRNA (guanine10-N2)-methyltransferase
MLDDILDFAALSLVDNGRLSFWMPTANDEDQEIHIPEHPHLQITSVCTQAFNRCQFKTQVLNARSKADLLTGSRRLITYRRIPDAEVMTGVAREQRTKTSGVNANDLNPFRRGYFQGFKAAFK